MQTIAILKTEEYSVTNKKIK